MSGNALRILLLTLVLAIAGCQPTEDVGPATKGGTGPAMATCPADLMNYCGIWDVKFSSEILKEKHMHVDDRFKIDVKSNSTDPNLWLFAGKDLEDRWIGTGNDKVKLAELTLGGAHDCLAGELRLTSHANGGAAHEWHQITIRTEEIPSPDFGTETRLEICFTERANNSPSTACEIAGCNEGRGDVLHGGRAHAQD